MKNIDIKITEELAVLSVSGSGYTKEINLEWRGAKVRYSQLVAGEGEMRQGYYADAGRSKKSLSCLAKSIV